MAGQVAIIGAGLMGAGIAQVAAVAGWQVTLRDLTDEATERGVAYQCVAAKVHRQRKDERRGRRGRSFAYHHDNRPFRGRRRGPRRRGGVREA